MHTGQTERPQGTRAPGVWWPRTLAAAAVAVLVAGSLVFVTTWAVAGEDAVSDTWVGALMAVALLVGLVGSLVAAVAALVDLARTGTPPRSRLALLTFPTVVVVLLLLELLVME